MMNSVQWTFELLMGREGFEAVRNDWQALADCLQGLHFAQCPQWAEAYLSYLAPRPHDLCWVTARRDGALQAVLPLERTTKGLGWFGVRELHTLVHDHMTLADIVADPADAPSLWPALMAWLQREAPVGWDRLTLPQLAEESTLAQSLALHPAPGQVSMVVDGSAWLDCDRSYEALLKAATSKHRSNLSRGARRAKEMGALRYEVHTQPEALEAAFAQFMAVEGSGWKGQQGTAINCDPTLVAFYQQLVRSFGVAQQCEIDLLWLDDKVIASGLWFKTGGCLYLQKVAYLEELSAVSPGTLLMAEALERTCADPSMRRLSVITRCTWADGWRTTVMPVWRHVVYPATVRGRATAWWDDTLSRLKTQVKGWLRRDPAPTDSAPAAT